MEEKDNKFQKIVYIIVGILITVLLIFLGSYLDRSTTNSTDNVGNIKLYNNIGMDNNLLNILYFNVGQADSTLITINNKVMLIDAGNPSDGYYISEFLKAQNISTIDYLIGTHVDEDHIGGLHKIIEEFNIGTLYMPFSNNDKSFYINLQETLNKNNLKRTPVEASDNITYSLGTATFKILNIDNTNPPIANDEAINDSSIVIQLEYGSKKYLFMGDASSKVEESRTWGKVDVLKVGHHGSKKSTSEKFLLDVKPTYVIISAGNNKKYNHPDSEVIERLEDKDIGNVLEKNIFITRKNSKTIWLKSNGNEIDIQELNDNLDGANRKVSVFEYIKVLATVILKQNDTYHHLVTAA